MALPTAKVPRDQAALSFGTGPTARRTLASSLTPTFTPLPSTLKWVLLACPLKKPFAAHCRAPCLPFPTLCA